MIFILLMRSSFIFFFIIVFIPCIAQKKISAEKRGDYRLMFYNVENLFDIYDDPFKGDDDFTPGGKNTWNYDRYQNKLNNVYKVIIAIGGWTPPEIIGLCEVENRKVLNDLIENTPLKKAGYEIVHKESPDERGIDVALLYLKKKFKPLSYQAIPVNFPDDPRDKTRDILMIKGIINKRDTLYVFINHFPSRSGGQARSEPKRMYTASLLRGKVDSIFACTVNPGIIIMGDLNDDPDNRSIMESLKVKITSDNIVHEELYNLSYRLFKEKKLGTLKYRGKWNLFDQIIISGSLLDKDRAVYTSEPDAHIFKQDNLLEKDPDGGMQLKRTYEGLKYKGGFSDHLPVYLDLWKR